MKVVDKEFEERVIQIKRVSKKTKGGSKMSFTALVVVGNRNGRVGFGFGKAGDVPTSVQKAVTSAKKSMVEVVVHNGTIPYELTLKYGASIVKMKPAPEGSGVIAGGAIRQVMELAGIKDISAKMLGSTNKGTSVKGAIEALSKFRKEI